MITLKQIEKAIDLSGIDDVRADYLVACIENPTASRKDMIAIMLKRGWFMTELIDKGLD